MKQVIAIVVAAVVFATAPTHAEDIQKIAGAETAALTWLALTDQGEFASCWDQAAGLFRASISQANWVTAIATVRAPLGKVVARKLQSATFARSLPQAPDGEYVVIRYQTQFENKPQAIETITPALENDGSWRVSGYYVR